MRFELCFEINRHRKVGDELSKNLVIRVRIVLGFVEDSKQDRLFSVVHGLSLFSSWPNHHGLWIALNTND